MTGHPRNGAPDVPQRQQPEKGWTSKRRVMLQGSRRPAGDYEDWPGAACWTIGREWRRAPRFLEGGCLRGSDESTGRCSLPLLLLP